MTFALNPIQHPHYWILEFTGRLDTQASMALEQNFQSLLQALPPHTILDLSALDYIASAGLRMILLALKQAKQQNCAISMCGLQESVAQVLHISGFLNLLTVHATREAALGQLPPAAS